MSSTEWQNAVRAWMIAGAVEQELWRRLSNAQITDADPLTMEAQRRMEQLSAEQGSQRVRLMFEAKPALRDELQISVFMAYFLNVTSSGSNQPVAINRADPQRLPRDATRLM